MIKDDDIAPAMQRIHTTQTLDDMKDRDIVIEAATEDESVKRKIFQDLCPRLDSHTLIASNTSSISITGWRHRPTGPNISSGCIS